MDWLDIYIPELGKVCMRRLDMRFHALAEKRLDYDFNSPTIYTGDELDAALQTVSDIVHGRINQHPVVLESSWGQSVIIGADEAAELLPSLLRAVLRSRHRSNN